MSCRPPDPGRPAVAPQVRAVGISSTLASFPGAGGVAPGNEASTTREIVWARVRTYVRIYIYSVAN